MDHLSEYTGNKYNLNDVFISNKTVEPNFFIKGRIRDVSCEGMSFESDYPFCCEDSIFFKMPNIFCHEINDSERLYSANVKWSRHLRHSEFQNEYGVEFTEPLQFSKKIVSATKGHQQSLSLPKLLRIAGMGILILCCGLNIFSFLRPISEPIELTLIGLGLLSFAQCIKIIARDSKSDDIKKFPKDISSLASQITE